MKANKYSIFLMHTFKIVSLINMPKFAAAVLAGNDPFLIKKHHTK